MNPLPIYPEWAKLPVETTTGLAIDPACTRCELGTRMRDTRKRVCLPPQGDPGGVYAVVDAAVTQDMTEGKPLASATGRMIREAIGRVWQGPVMYDVAVRCAPGEFAGSLSESAEACRPYLAQTLQAAAPQKVLAFGYAAYTALLGRTPPPHSVRHGYTWLNTVPVYLLLGPRDAAQNRFYRKQLAEDIEWALTQQPPFPRGHSYRDSKGKLHGVAWAIETQAESQAALDAAKQARWAALDFEWRGVVHDDDFRLISMALTPFTEHGVMEDAYVWSEEQLHDPRYAAGIKAYLQDPTAKKVGQNLKDDMHSVFVDLGVWIQGLSVDTRLVRRLLDANVEAAHLKIMGELVGAGGHKDEMQEAMDKAVNAIQARQTKNARTRTGFLFPGDDQLWPGLHPDVNKWLLAGRDVERYKYSYVQPALLHRYNARDTVTTGNLAALLESRLQQEPDLEFVWQDILQPLSLTFAKLQAVGVKVDVSGARTLSVYLRSRQEEIGKQFEPYGFNLQAFLKGSKEVGDFNPNTPQDVARVLFDELKLSGRQDRSTAAEVLEELEGKHPIVKAILDWRAVTRAKTAYADGMQKHVRMDGRIHCTFNPDGTECLPAGELLLTSRGYLPIEEARVGDKVITHMGRVREVVGTVVNPPQHVYRVRLSNGLTLRTSGNHEYYTKDCRWVRADSLALGDVVTVFDDPEEWREVEGWPFSVSSWGRVRAVSGKTRASQPKGKWGHLKVTLERGDGKRRAGNRKDFAVHRLVAAAFCADSTGPEVRHLNGVAWDNAARNLRYGTTVENGADAQAHGTRLHHGRAKLSRAQVEWIRAQPKVSSRQARGPLTDAGIAAVVGCSRELVREIRAGKRRADLRTENECGPRASFFYSSVVSLELEGLEPTYGVRVAEDCSHVTGGIVTHNTGRISTQDPSLQNITRGGTTEGKMVRDMFVATPGYLLVEADYSQLELRIAAFLADDKELRAVLSDPTRDIHMEAARYVSRMAWGVEPDQVTKEQRDLVKSFVIYKLAYGGGDEGMAAGLGCTVKEAAQVRAAIFGKYKAFSKWCDDQRKLAAQTGVVWSWWKGRRARRRPLWDIGGQDKGAAGSAARSSFNTPIQGTGNDFCLASLNALTKHLEEDGLDARVILPVHDSILGEVREECLDEYVYHLRRIMQGWPSEGVPMVVDVKYGERWGSMQKYKR